MGMSIDEIIAKETEIAQEFQKVIDNHIVGDNSSLEEMYCDDTEIIEEQLQRCKVFADYHNQIANTMRKYQLMQADYENRLKADMVAMLTEIQLEIREYHEIGCDEDCNNCRMVGCVEPVNVIKDLDIIQEKINVLRGE